MATLPEGVLEKLRQNVARRKLPISWSKVEGNAIYQAIEDYFETTFRPGVSGAINGAKAGLSVAQKTQLVKWYLLYKWDKE